MKRLAAAIAASAFCAVAIAQQGIQLQAFPTMSVADGRSTVTITATVRDANGKTVPDGTRVVFSTTLGNFREPMASTAQGIARAVLVAPGVPGTSRITVNALASSAAPNIMEFEFVGDRSLLSSAQEYIEVVSPTALTYTADSRWIAASAVKQGVSIRYRDVTINAEDVQIDTSRYMVRARKARLRFGKVDRQFDELYFRLNQRKGVGTSSYRDLRYDTIGVQHRWPIFLQEQSDGSYSGAKEEERFGLVEVTSSGVTRSAGADPSLFDFEDLSNSPSTIRAKKAVVFPRRGVQFQKAEIFVGTTRVMTMPLYELNPNASNSPIVTDQLFFIRDSSLGVNYPHYLSLKPGQTSLLRLRTGDALGRSSAANRGMFLDYELNWNRGDEWDGGLTFGGIGRNDWTLGLRQFWQVDSRTSVFASLQSPNGQSIFGSGSASKQFRGYSVNASGNISRSLRGIEYTSHDWNMSAESDQRKVGRMPLQYSVGATMVSSYNSLVGRTVTGTGIYSRFQSNPLPLDKRSSLSASLTTRLLGGNGAGQGLTWYGTATMSRQINNAASMVATYDYTKDGFTDSVLGSHRVSLNGNYYLGATNINMFATKSLDADRMSLYGDFSYRLAPVWRLGYTYTWDKILDRNYLDYGYFLNYRIGWREVGLTWSKQTGRIGFQIMGATGF
ncbi:hypothetical protein EON81_01265 [bacterium]|nr:MAG: hypothetical protein EON81_01265 [bacterium]